MIKRDLMEVGASLLGGLGLGAVAMYLLDPDKGVDRRRKISRQTQDMLSGASDRLHQAKSRVMHLPDEAAEYAGQARQKIRDLRSEAGEYLHRGTQQVESHLDGALPKMAAVVGAMALGCGIMFMMDPVSGRRRRARLRDKATRYAHETTQTLYSTGRHMTDRAKGMYHDAKEKLHGHDGHRLGAVEEHGEPVGR